MRANRGLVFPTTNSCKDKSTFPVLTWDPLSPLELAQVLRQNLLEDVKTKVSRSEITSAIAEIKGLFYLPHARR